MDRRTAGALLALAACIATSAAAPTASDHTALDLYEGGSGGCYYNFQHYGEGDRIMTNEPCLNCTCHNRMLMCYLRVCPFTKAIGQDCTVEKRADQCCPIVTCPDVPVDLLTSTSTTSPAEYGATGLGKPDKYGCSINGKYFPEGSKVPSTPNKPCEHCYCIRNMTTCVMQECTLHVDGCTPIYHKDVCCPIRYSCDHLEDEVPLLDDMSTTVRPTPGFLLTTTTSSPVTQMSQDCVHNYQIIADGASITTEKACEHCYCMKGDIVCVVQECGAPMENEGKNCTSLPPREGQCCPDTYICEGDDISSENPNASTTDSILEQHTTLLPPKNNVEGSGYRNEPNEAPYTEMPYTEHELEGSGEEGLDTTKPLEEHESSTSGKPLQNEEITTNLEDGDQYIPVTTKPSPYKESETSTENIDKESIIPQKYPTSDIPGEDVSDINVVTQNLPQEHITLAPVRENYDQHTTETIDSLNTVSDVLPEKNDQTHEYASLTTSTSILDETNPIVLQESMTTKGTTSIIDQSSTLNHISDETSETESYTPNSEILNSSYTSTTEKSLITSETIMPSKKSEMENDVGGITETSTTEGTIDKKIIEETEITKSDHYNTGTTNTPMNENDKLTTELNLELNTVIAAEKESFYPHVSTTETTEKATELGIGSTQKDNVLKSEEHMPTVASILIESEPTIEPDKGLNTIPSEIDEESHSQPSVMKVTNMPVQIKTTETPVVVDKTTAQEIEKSSMASEIPAPSPEFHVTKADLYTITTEPSFRKEDEISISTVKPKEDYGPTTIKTEFVDEGLIPTSTHDEKLSTGADIPSTYEDITTIEAETELTIPSEQSSTESIPKTSDSLEMLPAISTEPSYKLESTLLPSTEKSPVATSVIPDADTYEEPSRIPGEGDCLWNGVTYKNNTVVPNTNNCHTGCKCISSIIKCDPIICSPPPDYMSNCQSIYDTPDSCCPTYICDHPRETIQPQSDNQMSGTEAPVNKPTIECRGDQCELSVPTKPTETPSSDSVDKNMTNECGPDGCDNLVKEPIFLQPTVEHPKCTDDKCGSSAVSSDTQQPIKPCNGDECKSTDDGTQGLQLCKNEEDCKKIEVPITQMATGDIISSPHGNPPEICKEEGGCKPEESTTFDCAGDKPCRRKNPSVAEQLPSKCEGDGCLHKIDTSNDQDISQLSTVASVLDETPLKEVTEKIESVDKVSTDSSVSDQEKLVTMLQTPFITEQPPVPTEYTAFESSTDMKPIRVTEDTLEEQKEISTEQNFTEKEHIKDPTEIENLTNNPISSADVYTQQPNEIQNTAEKETTQIPEEAEHTTESISEKVQETSVPTEIDQEQTDKQEKITTETTKTSDVSDVYTHNPPEASTSSEELSSGTSDSSKESTDRSTQIPDVAEDHKMFTNSDSTKSDIIQQSTDEPNTQEVDYATKYTDAPHTTFVQKSETSDIAEKEPEYILTTDKVISGTNTPSITKEYSDNLTEKAEVSKEHTEKITSVEEPSTRMPIITEKLTDESISVTEKDTIPSDHGLEYTDSNDEQSTKLPDFTEKQQKGKPTLGEEDNTKISIATEEYHDKPTKTEDFDEAHTLVYETSTNLPHITDEQSYVPDFGTEEGTETPNYEAGHTGKPTLAEEQDLKIPEKEIDDKLIPALEKNTEISQITEDKTDESVSIPPLIKEQSDVLDLSDTVKEHGDESTMVPESGTKVLDVIEEHTNKPVSTAEENTQHPGGEVSHQTSLPEVTLSPFDESKTPTIHEELLPDKSVDMKEILEKQPDFSEKDGVTEPVLSEVSGTENLEVVEGTTKKPVLIDESLPDEMEGSTDDTSITTEKTSTEKLVVPDEQVIEKASEKVPLVSEDHISTSSEAEHTTKPDISEINTNAPELKITQSHENSYQTPDEEEFGTKAPETFSPEPESNTKQPILSMDDETKTTDMRLEKVTEIPTSELKTTERDEGVHTDPHLVTDATTLPEVTSKSPNTSDGSTNESQDTSADLPNETTEVSSIVTISKDTLPPLREKDQTTHQPSDEMTPSEELVTVKYETPKTILTTDSVEKATEPTDQVTVNKQGDETNEISEQERAPLGTQSPIEVTHAGPTDEESYTKVHEEEKIKPSTADSHFTDIVPGLGNTSMIPETVSVTEVVGTETPEIRLPEPHDDELANIPTKAVEIPDVHIPQREDTITGSTESTVTVEPVKGFTEDASITVQEQTSSGFNEDTTKYPTNSQTDNGSTTLVSISKISDGLEESHTDSHAGSTEVPSLKETIPVESYETSTSNLSVSPQETSDSDQPLSGEPHRRTETIALEHTTPYHTSEPEHTSKSPVHLVTEPEATIVSVAISEEKTTKAPELHVTTIEAEIYGTREPTATEKPKAQETATDAPEQSKTTGLFYSESHMTDDQETSMNTEETQPVHTEEATEVPILSIKPDSESLKPTTDVQKSSTEIPATVTEIRTDIPHTQITTTGSITEHEPDVSVPYDKHDDTETTFTEIKTETQQQTTEGLDTATSLPDTNFNKEATKPVDRTTSSVDYSETTPYLIELEEHTHKIIDDVSTLSPVDEKDSTYTIKEDHLDKQSITPSSSEEEHTVKVEEQVSTTLTSIDDRGVSEDTSPISPSVEDVSTETELHDLQKVTDKVPEDNIDVTTKQTEIVSSSSEETSTAPGLVDYQTTLSEAKETDVETKPTREQTTAVPVNDKGDDVDKKDKITSKPLQDFETTLPTAVVTDTDKSSISESDIKAPTKDESAHSHLHENSDKTTVSVDEPILSTMKPTTVKQEELLTPPTEEKYSQPEEKPSGEPIVPTAEAPKPPVESEPTEEMPGPDDDGLSSSTGYGEPDYGEEDQAFGPGTCRYGGKVYVSAQQIPRDDPCDFCFCFRSDIICLQQSCPPPIHGCHEEPIQGFCCPRYECPVSMATTVNVTTTTTTTTTTLPPHFPTHGYRGAAQRRGCQIKGHAYKVGEVVRASSGPCLHCTCGGDGQMKCDPKACTPEPMLRQMIAAAVSAKRRR